MEAEHAGEVAHAVGLAVPHQLRAAAIQLKEESEADKAAGRRGKTWQQIADAAGGPTTAVTFALAEASRRHPNLFPRSPAQVSCN